MTEGKRPGGLTALAVLNFVFGGFNALVVLGFLALLALLAGAKAAGDSTAGEAKKVAEALEHAPLGMFYLYVALALVAMNTLLLIASGVGYIQQKKFLGRALGNCYGGLAVVYALIGLWLPKDAGGGFGIMTIVGLIYPVLTLILLNSTFKEDFIH